jgi:hypothetical protein
VADPLGVSIAFDAPVLEPSPTWTRIDTLSGCRVRSWQIDRGRPTEFDKTGTGTAVVQIVDRAGLFDPTNPLSAYHNKILPGKQAAIALQNPTGAHAWFTLCSAATSNPEPQARPDPPVRNQSCSRRRVAILARAELRVGIDAAVHRDAGREALASRNLR